jgi:arginyl-tRNA synthetase
MDEMCYNKGVFMNSETFKLYLSHILSQALSNTKLTPFLDTIDISVPDSSFGDYSTNTALVLSKKLKKAPKEIAALLIEQLTVLDTEKVFSEISEKGGFINLKVSQESLLKKLHVILEQRDLYGCTVSGSGKKILVEYFQPNIAKPLHLGHLSNAIVGDSLFRILKSQGFQAESDTHVGDWGTQFGLLLLAFKKYGDMSVVEKSPIEELNKLYVKINSEIEADPQIREQGKQEFVKLEQGDTENRKLWEQFRDWSWKEYEIMYTDLGIRRADHGWAESFYEDKMPAVVEELKLKGLLVESQGAQIINLEQQGLGVAVVVKSDGGTTYLLRDLAGYIFRKGQGFERQLYVVDIRQQHQLKQTFKILELMGVITLPDEAVHIAYGFLKLPEGAMSTRKGTIVNADEFIRSVQASAAEIIEAKNSDLKNKHLVAKEVASAAMKYFQLSHNLKSDIIFDPKKVISFEGSTGPYLQYTHARIHGILRKGSREQVKGSSLTPETLNLKPMELAVLRKLSQYPEIVSEVAKDFLPNQLCNYLFELSQTFNSFYQDVPVLQEPNEEIKDFRLQLITATAQVIKNGLYLLGIEAPEEM